MATVDDLKAEIAELRERLGQNSSNSSRPPSADPPYYKPQPPREPRGRKRGGQPGHQGHARQFVPPEEVDHVIDLKPKRCTRCGQRLHGADPQAERRQVASRRRQVCWAHLARDFQAMVERGGESEQTGRALLKQVKRLFELWHKVRAGDLGRARLQTAIKPVRQKVKELLAAGARAGHHKTRNTCANILKVERCLWTFVRAEGVEPTNNSAERALRRAVLWRRKSFGTQSETGSRFVERILSVVTTLRQQGRDVMEYLTAACAWAQGESGSICLLPDSS